MKLCIPGTNIESISLKERVRMGLGETEMTLIYVKTLKTTIHFLQCACLNRDPAAILSHDSSKLILSPVGITGVKPHAMMNLLMTTACLH